MANFVVIHSEFETYKEMLLERFTNADFQDNPFNSRYKYFIGFEFDFIFHESFFGGLKNFLSKNGDSCSIFYTIKPSPEEYFYSHFNKFSVFTISNLASNKELSDILTKDPGDSPADNICTNSNQIAWFSNFKEYAIIGSRDWEIAVVGFTDISIKKQFIDSFSEDARTMYTTIERQTLILDEILNFNIKAKEAYRKLSDNYVDRK